MCCECTLILVKMFLTLFAPALSGRLCWERIEWEDKEEDGVGGRKRWRREGWKRTGVEGGRKVKENGAVGRELGVGPGADLGGVRWVRTNPPFC